MLESVFSFFMVIFWIFTLDTILRKSSLVFLSLAEGQWKNTEGKETLWNPQIQDCISSGKVWLWGPCSDLGRMLRASNNNKTKIFCTVTQALGSGSYENHSFTKLPFALLVPNNRIFLREATLMIFSYLQTVAGGAKFDPEWRGL